MGAGAKHEQGLLVAINRLVEFTSLGRQEMWCTRGGGGGGRRVGTGWQHE